MHYADILAKFHFRWKVCEPHTAEGKTGVILENRMAHKSLHKISIIESFKNFIRISCGIKSNIDCNAIK